MGRPETSHTGMIRFACAPDTGCGPGGDGDSPSVESRELDSLDGFDGGAGLGFGSDERDGSDSGELRASSFDEAGMSASQEGMFRIIARNKTGRDSSASPFGQSQNLLLQRPLISQRASG